MLGVGPLCLPALGTLATRHYSETAGMGVVMVTRCVGGAESWTLIYQHDREQPAPQYLAPICWLVGIFIYKPSPRFTFRIYETKLERCDVRSTAGTKY